MNLYNDFKSFIVYLLILLTQVFRYLVYSGYGAVTFENYSLRNYYFEFGQNYGHFIKKEDSQMLD